VAYFESPEVDISSSRIRALVKSGESISGLVTSDVEAYIRAEKLYV
jgi:nicotinic acid mononucleotide adenylyltransferase